MASIEGCRQYRLNLAQSLTRLRENGQKKEARRRLKQTQRTPVYQVARQVSRQPDIFQIPPDEGYREYPELNGRETMPFEYYTSNEYYGGLETEIANLGGVGLAVGSDQGLDFFNMARLNEIYCVDIDPHTHTPSLKDILKLD
jgi:hypothetical protein